VIYPPSQPFWDSEAFWQGAEYLALSVVFLGVVGETLADIAKWPPNAGVRERLARISAFVLIFGLALEIPATIRTTQISALEIATLEAGIQPRSLSLKQQDEIAGHMMQFSGRRVRVWSYLYDSESFGLCSQLSNLLAIGGMTVQSGCGCCVINDHVLGVRLRGGKGQEEFLSQFLEVAKSKGIDPIIIDTNGPVPTGDDIDLFVGIKPPIFMRPQGR
jgi:hypothetical protein